MATGHHDRHNGARRDLTPGPYPGEPFAPYPVQPRPGRHPCLEERPFPSRPAVVAEVRVWTWARLAVCQVDPDVLDLATLLISEIATNAVLHARGHGLVVRLVTDGELEAAVHDQDRQHQPHLAQPEPDDLHGRGLALVEALADDWGTETDPTGKWVWFRLSL